jgi:hypothetical protein
MIVHHKIIVLILVFCNIFVTGIPVKFGLLSPGEHGSDGVAPTQVKGGIGPFQPILTFLTLSRSL